MRVDDNRSEIMRAGRCCRAGSTAAAWGIVRVAGGVVVLAAGVLVFILKSAPALGAPKDDRPTCVAIASDPMAPPANPLAVTSDHKGKVFRWSLKPIHQDHTFKDHGSKASYVSVSLATNAQRVFTAGYDGKVIVSNLMEAGGNPQPVAEFAGHIPANPQPWEIPEVWVVVPSADGQRALSAANNGQILYWAVDDGTPAHKPARLGTFEARADALDEWVGGLAFVPVGSGNETQFVSSHANGVVLVWNFVGADPHFAPQRKFWHGNDRPVNSVAVTRNGKIVSAGFDKTVRIWDINDPNNNQTTSTPAHPNWIWRVALSPNDDKIASACEDGKVRLFGIDGVPLRDNMGNEAVLPPAQTEPDGIMGVAFVDQNTIVYTTGSTASPQVKLWPISGFSHP